MSLEGVQELKSSLRGNLFLAGEQGFISALRVWAISPYQSSGELPQPAVVVQPRGTADVVAAVKFAAKNGLPVSVKCGGHGAGNPSCVEGGVMIHMALMRSVHVDPESKTAVVDGGCLAADVDDETALYGLACPLGVCPTVGVGGLALNGGLSLLSRAYGAVCDNILEAQMVLADGSVVNVTPKSDPELFWALRGAGTALGVVTKLKLRAYDVSDLYCGIMVWPDDAEHNTYRGVLRFIKETVLPNPAVGFNATRAIDPEQGPVVICMIALTGDESREEKDALLKPLRDLGPVVDTAGKSTWRQTQDTHGPAIKALTAAMPVRYEVCAGGHIHKEKFTEDLIDTWLAETCDALPVPECATTLSFFELAGGKLKESSGPLGIRADIQWVAQVGWAEPAAHETGKAYGKRLTSSMASFTADDSGYVNMWDSAEWTTLSAERAAANIGGMERLKRLAAVKARVDPDNVFKATVHRLTVAASA